MRVRRVARATNATAGAIDRVRPTLFNLSEVESLAVLRLLSDIMIANVSSFLFLSLYVNSIVCRYPASAAAEAYVSRSVL